MLGWEGLRHGLDLEVFFVCQLLELLAKDTAPLAFQGPSREGGG
jgi:hypothetical protein